MRRAAVSAALCLLALAAGAPAQYALAPDGKPKEVSRVELSWGVPVPMRDGVRLNATVYKPAERLGPLPAIVTMTPYVADNYHDNAAYFAGHGYHFVIVDSRGRGNSEGAFEPFANEARDGYDVVEWVAKQDWCNGRVGMWGGSYAGTNQWATLREGPPHLKTIVPVASAHPGVDVPAPGGIMSSYWIRWLTLTAGTTGNRKLFLDESFWIAKFRERYLLHQPFRELGEVVGNPTALFRKWVEHRLPDAYWDAMVPRDEDYARFDVPILTITGQYDGDQLGAMEFYHRHMRHGGESGRERHYLVIGPWDHAGTREPKEEVGGLTFGKASLLDMPALHKSWYDHTLKGGPRPAQLTHRVQYYVAGLERWKHADDLDGLPTVRRKWHLHSTGRADDAFHSGTLKEGSPGDAPPDRFTYDPRDTRPAELEKNEVKNVLTDQRYALNLFGAGLVYHSEPLPRATEVSGYFRFVTWVKLDVPDTDFRVSLYEIQPDGTSVFLTDDRLRARYRDSRRQARPVPVGEVCRYEFDGFQFISRRLLKGSRLRLVFQCPNSIYLEKNYNSGGAVEDETLADARVARVTLYHDADRPSYLEVPVAEE